MYTKIIASHMKNKRNIILKHARRVKASTEHQQCVRLSSQKFIRNNKCIQKLNKF